jgi:hypothetical protein
MTTQERVEKIRREIESAACEHGEWMCSYCENIMIGREIDAAVDERRAFVRTLLAAEIIEWMDASDPRRAFAIDALRRFGRFFPESGAK